MSNALYTLYNMFLASNVLAAVHTRLAQGAKHLIFLELRRIAAFS